jgi:ABC-2 type transport system permease protein
MTAMPLRRPLLAAPVRALIRKELREYRSHRMILITALGMPSVFMLLPFLNLIGLQPEEQKQIDIAVGQAMFAFFLAPVIVPAALAAYSIVGEREQDTLEPLLTLPMTERQLITGKVLGVMAPAVTISIAVYLGYVLISLAAVHGPQRDEALDPIWAVGIISMAAPLSLYSTLLGMAVSSRAKDLRVAEQLAGMFIIPSMAPVALVTFQVVPVTLLTWAAFFGIVAVVDVLLMGLVLRMFERERAVAMAS